jgi:hypothetical protein
MSYRAEIFPRLTVHPSINIKNTGYALSGMVTKCPRRMDRQTDGHHSKGYLTSSAVAELIIGVQRLEKYYLNLIRATM